MDRSRMPPMAMFRVRGMGVAVSVSRSTSARRALSRSFWRTPKRCSSSTMTSPRFLNLRSLLRSLWVPIRISTLPSALPCIALFTSASLRSREITSTRTGQSANRSRKLSPCCCASRVVGTSTPTCLPFCTARNAARMATSVLPNPTSPHTSRSMGVGPVMSATTASMVIS